MHDNRVPTDQGKFFQSGKSGKNIGFQPKRGKTFSNQGNFPTVGRWMKSSIWLLVWLCGEVLLLGSVSVINWCFCKHYPNGKWRPHLKRTIGFFC